MRLLRNVTRRNALGRLRRNSEPVEFVVAAIPTTHRGNTWLSQLSAMHFDAAGSDGFAAEFGGY